jgi:rhodanese-related sulfurtransferase
MLSVLDESGPKGDGMAPAWLDKVLGRNSSPQPGRVDVRQANQALAADKRALIIDVREPGEWADTGVVPRALLIPLGQLEQRATGKIAKGVPVYTICRSGHRSMVAAKKLASMGYTDVKSVDGGMRAWVAAGLPVKARKR